MSPQQGGGWGCRQEGVKGRRKESHEESEEEEPLAEGAGASRKSRRQGRCREAQVAGGLEAKHRPTVHSRLIYYVAGSAARKTQIFQCRWCFQALVGRRKGHLSSLFSSLFKGNSNASCLGGKSYQGCVSWVTLIVQKHM